MKCRSGRIQGSRAGIVRAETGQDAERLNELESCHGANATAEPDGHLKPLQG
jgi:hypothetical protein